MIGQPTTELPDVPIPSTPGVETPASNEPNKLMQLLKSRKFWAALVGLGLVVTKAYDPNFPLAEDQVTNLVYVLVAYILGTAVEEGLKAKASNVPKA